MKLLHDLAFMVLYLGCCGLAIEALKMIRQNFDMKRVLMEAASAPPEKLPEIRFQAKTLLKKRYSVLCGLKPLPHDDARRRAR